ncbi:MAG: indolepyruvate oxidoreductase subunit beta family protein [Marinovum sp.]|nr:indolepyruvate oxidoreductase subunit beta family protein [Marinovum sp.]
MTSNSLLEPLERDEKLNAIIKLAIMAVGGQGGGALTSWIESLARAQGYDCQATSVAGVAQRTGATIYYIEMAEKSDATPIFSLAPAQGDVDILIAAEMMEAGRAIMRGFVTPDRTTLIASTHRALAVSEKMVPGDGIAASDEVSAAAEIAADRAIKLDLNQVAIENGSVISSALFGALAASGALPFPKSAFEQSIRASGKGVDASLRAFRAAYEIIHSDTPHRNEPTGKKPISELVLRGPEKPLKDARGLMARVEQLPAAVRPMAQRGLRKVIEFQDTAYGSEYLGYLDRVLALDQGDSGYILSLEAAKYIANAMAYDDIIRVADLKTRAKRFARIRSEMAAVDRPVYLTDFFHPRAEEIAGLLPARLGARIEERPVWMARIERWFGGSRRLQTHRLGPFLALYMLGGLRFYRRKTLRHRYEQAHLLKWLDQCCETAPVDNDLAVEFVRCRRLVKGYSDTHTRSLSKFDQVLEGAQVLRGRPDAAQWVARLRDAALQDEQGKALEGALKTVESFAKT